MQRQNAGLKVRIALGFLLMAVWSANAAWEDVKRGDGMPYPLNWEGGLTFNDMYRKGVKVVRVLGPDDQAKGPDGKPLIEDGKPVYDSYVISMKEMTVRLDKDGPLVNAIGILDITDPRTPSATKIIPMSTRGEQLIQFWNGGPPFKLTIKMRGKNDYEVKLTRTNILSDADERKGKKSDDTRQPRQDLVTTFSELGGLRRQQVMVAGAVRIPPPNGKEYKVVPQGGPKGAFLFFDPEKLAQANTSTVDLVLPEGLCNVLTTKKGQSVLNGESCGIGKFDGDDYKLSYKHKAKRWEVEKGLAKYDPTEGGGE